MLCDLQSLWFDTPLWYSAAQDRVGWYDACQTIASRSDSAAGAPVAVIIKYGST